MEEKAPFENVGISFNLNQKLISSINGKGSIKNNGEEPISFLFLLYPIFFSQNERENRIKTKITRLINIDKNLNGFPDDQNISRKDKNLEEEIVNIKINKKTKRNLFFVRNIMMYFLTISSFIQIVLPNCELDFIQFQFSKITLKINGIGNKKILTSDNNFNSNYYPNIIYINSELQDTIKNSYYFNQTNNIVVLIWNITINYCKSMFYGCSDITEIDFSNFDS